MKNYSLGGTVLALKVKQLLNQGFNLGRAPPGIHVDAVDDRGARKRLMADFGISLGLIFDISRLLKVNRERYVTDRTLGCLRQGGCDILLGILATE